MDIEFVFLSNILWGKKIVLHIECVHVFFSSKEYFWPFSWASSFDSVEILWTEHSSIYFARVWQFTDKLLFSASLDYIYFWWWVSIKLALSLHGWTDLAVFAGHFTQRFNGCVKHDKNATTDRHGNELINFQMNTQINRQIDSPMQSILHSKQIRFIGYAWCNL